MKRFRFAMFLLALLSVPAPAYAHKIDVYAYSDGHRVHAIGTNHDGSACKGCGVEVLDGLSRAVLASGMTDEGGRFSFDVPPAEGIEIVLKAGPGHVGRFALGGDELRGSSPGRSDRDVQTADLHDTHELEEAMERALDSRLAPLVAEVARLRQEVSRPGAADIIGAIGYVLGLAGLAAYLKSRKAG